MSRVFERWIPLYVQTSEVVTSKQHDISKKVLGSKSRRRRRCWTDETATLGGRL